MASAEQKQLGTPVTRKALGQGIPASQLHAGPQYRLLQDSNDK